MSKPSILIIPGASGLPEFYESMVVPIAAKGYDIRALHMRTVGDKPGPVDRAPASMYDDAALIAKETEKLADDGKDVILIAHSYGGIPTTESCEGLGKEERLKEGKKGGIVRLAYMTCLVPALGETAAEVLNDTENALSIKMDDNGWLYQDDFPASARITFSDLSPEEGEAWMARFPRHSATSFGNKLTHEGYKTIPVSYLLCENDLCIPAKTQRNEIEMIERVSGRKVDVTNIESGHCPMASKPMMVVDWVLDIAEIS